MKVILAVLALLIGTTTSAFAKAEQCGMDCASCHSLSAEEGKALLKKFGEGIEVKEVKVAKVGGLFELLVESGGRQGYAYIDFSKKFLIPNVIEIDSKKPLSEPPARKIDVSQIPEKNSIVMGNEKGKKKIFVFTDPDCPYCAKLHAELHKLVKMEPDLAIYLKMFPLPMHPKAFDKCRVLLSKKSLALVDIAFGGGQLPEPTDQDSKEPVEETKKLAASLGINSTPTIIFPDGRIVPGAVEAETLRKMLNEEKKDDKQPAKKEEPKAEKKSDKKDAPKEKPKGEKKAN